MCKYCPLFQRAAPEPEANFCTVVSMASPIFLPTSSTVCLKFAQFPYHWPRFRSLILFPLGLREIEEDVLMTWWVFCTVSFRVVGATVESRIVVASSVSVEEGVFCELTEQFSENFQKNTFSTPYLPKLSWSEQANHPHFCRGNHDTHLPLSAHSPGKIN